MGRLRIKGEKKFVTVVQPMPASRTRQWFVAAMFMVGVLATLGIMTLATMWAAKHFLARVTMDRMRTLAQMAGAGGPATLVEFKDIDEELRYLRSLVTEWRGQPQIRNLAVQIVQDSGAEMRDKKAQALAIASWVQGEIYYIHELPERFQTPAETLRIKAGDCDDSTTLVCSLLESVGIPSQLVCMQINGAWSHIFPAALLTDRATLLPLDTTMRSSVLEVVNPIEWAKARGKTVAIKVL